MSLVSEDAGEAERNLRRDRDTARLEEAEQDQRGVAVVDEEGIHDNLQTRSGNRGNFYMLVETVLQGSTRLGRRAGCACMSTV